MNTYYVYEFEGEETTVDKTGTTTWPFFSEVAACIAMSDLSDQHITKIIFEGNEYRYAGWAPGMEYTFYNIDDPNDTYTVWMEHLDH